MSINEKNYKTQQECFDSADSIGDTFFYGIPNNRKGYEYNHCKDVKAFRKIQHDNKEDHYYNEMIREGQPCIEYYDFDDKAGDMNDIDGFIKRFIQLRNDFTQVPITRNQIRVYEACGGAKNKFSLHILIRNGTYYDDTEQLGLFVKKFDEWIGDKLIIDLSVYNKNSMLRCVGSTKRGEVRKFRPYDMEDDNYDGGQFISVVDLNVLKRIEPIVVIEPPKNDVVDTPIVELTGEELDRTMEKLRALKVSRWEDRNDWTRLIWLCRSIGVSFEAVCELSSQAHNHDEDACLGVWNSWSRASLGIGSLHFLLKQDVSDADYKAFMKADKNDNEDYDKKVWLTELTKKNIESFFETTGYIEKNDQWISPDIFKGDDKCVVVKGGLGRGKTMASISHITTMDYERIIVLTSRRSFARSVTSRLTKDTKHDFELYLDCPYTEEGLSEPFLVLQVESLWRLKLDGRKTLLLCDEVESVLVQMISASTHGKNHVKNVKKFEALFQFATKIIALDAFISSRTLNTMKTLKIPFAYYNYTKPLEKRTAIETDVKGLTSRIIETLKQGKKAFFFCSSNAKLRELFLPNIRKHCRDKVILEYHSQSAGYLSDINKTWGDADLVAVTSTITVGCNFDEKDIYSKVFIYANAPSKNLVRDMFQASARVRHIIDKTMVYCLEEKVVGKVPTTDKREIEKELKEKKDYAKKQFEEYVKDEDFVVMPFWLRDIIVGTIHEGNTSVTNLVPFFNRYLVECNYEVEVSCDEELEKSMEMDKPEKIGFAYCDIEVINVLEADRLVKKKRIEPITDYEQSQLCKYYFLTMVFFEGGDVVKAEPYYIDFLENKGRYHNLAYEKGFNQGLFQIKDVLEGDDTYAETSRLRALKIECIDDINKTLGLRHSQDVKNLTDDKLKESIEWAVENKDKWVRIFEIRLRKKDKPIGGAEVFTTRDVKDLINSVLKSWGMSDITRGKRTQVTVKGKRENVPSWDTRVKSGLEQYKELKPKVIRQRAEKNVRVEMDELD
jgi:hypothetical protein